MISETQLRESPSPELLSARPRWPSAHRIVPSVAVVTVYLLIGIAAFWPVSRILQRPFSHAGDYMLSVWFIAWVPHALSHLVNPFFSNAIFAPTGVNLAQNTASPLLGLVAAPLAPVLNPVARTNLLMVLSMPVSATAALVVLRKWKVWFPAAALGGLIYGFSPYMADRSLAHLELLFVPLPPFIAFTIGSILQRRGSPRRLGIQLGVLATAQYLISPEVLTTVAFFAIAAVVCVAVRHPKRTPDMVRTLVAPVGAALVVVAAVLAYPVWMMFFGPQHFTGTPVYVGNPFHNDVASFVAPGPMQKVSLGLRSLGTRLADQTDVQESDGYIGIPVLILAGIFAWRSRRSPRMQLTVALLVSAALLSLGPYLAVDGRLTGIPLPFRVLEKLPLLENVLPNRFSFEVDAFLAAIVAFGLDDVRRVPIPADPNSVRRLRRRRRMVAAITGATVAVVVVVQMPNWPNASSAPAELPSAIRRAIPAGDPIVISVPYDTLYSMQPMLWQSEDGFSFRQLGGYAYHPKSDGSASTFPAPMSPSGLQRFLVGGQTDIYGPPPPLTLGLVTATRTALTKYDVRAVIVDRSATQAGPAVVLFDAALGPPSVSAGQFSLWTGWRGRSAFHVMPGPSVDVILPAKGARLSGATVLGALTWLDPGATKVEYILTGPAGSNIPIAFASANTDGWLARWNTTSVPNGNYTLHGVAYNADGGATESPGTTITVQN